MAAGEQQGQPVIGAVAQRRFVRVRRRRVEVVGQVGEPAGAAQAVQGVASGGQAQPGHRIGGQPVAPPGDQGLDDRRLHGVFGQVEVTEPTRQPHHQPAGLLAQQSGQLVVTRRSGHSNCE